MEMSVAAGTLGCGWLQSWQTGHVTGHSLTSTAVNNCRVVAQRPSPHSPQIYPNVDLAGPQLDLVGFKLYLYRHCHIWINGFKNRPILTRIKPSFSIGRIEFKFWNLTSVGFALDSISTTFASVVSNWTRADFYRIDLRPTMSEQSSVTVKSSFQKCWTITGL